jgi:hypothetical protein
VSEDTPWHGTRSWTAAEATAALPLVRRIVDDLVIAYRRWREAVEAFEYATSGTRADLPNAEADELMTVAQRLAAEIDGYRGELAKLEVRVLRVDRGLVAFRSERDGEVTSLFWSPGAPAPTYTLSDPESEEYGTSISWPSLAQVVAGKRSRA